MRIRGRTGKQNEYPRVAEVSRSKTVVNNLRCSTTFLAGAENGGETLYVGASIPFTTKC
jgi:hypothetical protein